MSSTVFNGMNNEQAISCLRNAVSKIKACMLCNAEVIKFSESRAQCIDVLISEDFDKRTAALAQLNAWHLADTYTNYCKLMTCTHAISEKARAVLAEFDLYVDAQPTLEQRAELKRLAKNIG